MSHHQHRLPSQPPLVSALGRTLIPPQSTFQVAMGNESSKEEENSRSRNTTGQASLPQSTGASSSRPMSNLSVLLNQGGVAQPSRQSRTTASRAVSNVEMPSEADFASGPPVQGTRFLGSSAPCGGHPPPPVVPPTLYALNPPPAVLLRDRSNSERVRRCISSKELGTLAPASGSPYQTMMSKKDALASSMRLKLQALREAPVAQTPDHASEESSSSRKRATSNALRNQKRAQHAQAVVEDLCDIVAELFIAESKLLKPMQYGVSPSRIEKQQVVASIHSFVSALPYRYALGADTPSEVLLHMRLMAAVRADAFKAAVHIHSLDGDTQWSQASDSNSKATLRLVTIACRDKVGLLEYLTKLLGTGGSRVLDADVSLSKDGIVLDRFVVEMSGRLRLDKLANLIEAFLKEGQEQKGGEEESSCATSIPPRTPSSVAGGGPLYFHSQEQTTSRHDLQREMETAVPLSQLLVSNPMHSLSVPVLPGSGQYSSSSLTASSSVAAVDSSFLKIKREKDTSPHITRATSEEDVQPDTRSNREKRPLVNRRGTSDLDNFAAANVEDAPLDYVTVPTSDVTGHEQQPRSVPLIPFEELMLIETLGRGRVSTIYRAVWQRHALSGQPALPTEGGGVHMVALKVAMLDAVTGDTSHLDEVRREADIAARLQHPNICHLVGVAADSECFCLAYDFCDGGSLLSLLSNPTRLYEYLPIALDIANGMAYLHSRNIIHRDLKPSNILLTRDHRAKIADFGMSVANMGQELTAETGTYRYMAPEVIRHESYSSNADVYSFGLVLWQLITREIPFGTMTPIQAAYAVAEGRRPAIPKVVPQRLREIIQACWDHASHKRPSFTYIAMALADYARMAFSPANVGASTLQIANEMLANVDGNSNVNVDFTTPVVGQMMGRGMDSEPGFAGDDSTNNIGLEI